MARSRITCATCRCIIHFTVQKRDADNLLDALRKIDGATIETV